MAQFVSQYYGNKRIQLDISEIENNPVSNQTNISWTVTVLGNNGYHWDSSSVYLAINGTELLDTTWKADPDGSFPESDEGDNQRSGTMWIAHNADGTKTVAVTFDVAIHTAAPEDHGGSFLLTPIDRSGPSVSLSIDNVTESGFRITISTGAQTCDQFKYSTDGGTTWNTLSGEGTSKSSQIMGLLANHEYNVRAWARRKYNAVGGYSSTQVVKTLGPSKITEIYDMEIGSACAVSWVPYGDDFKYKLKFVMLNQSYTTDFITPGVEGSSYTYTGYTFPMNLCNSLTDDVQADMTVTLYSYDSDGTSLGSSDSKTVKIKVPESVVPTISVTSGEDIGQSAFSDVLQNASRLHIVFAVAGAYGSTVDEVKLWYGDQEWTAEVVNGVAELTTGSITSSGQMSTGYSVTDSRGRSAGDSWTENVIPYHFPEISKADLTYTRTTVTLKAEGSISPVNNQNTKHLKLTRIDMMDQSETMLYDNDLNAYDFSGKWTDQPEYLNTRNYKYVFMLTDSVTAETKEVSVHPGRLHRFDELDESKYYIGMDEEGWKMEGIDGRLEDGKVIVERTDGGDDPAGVGFPVRMKENTAYELIYGGEIDDDTYVFFSFFDKDYYYIGSYDYSRRIPIGTNIVAPNEAAWGVLILGRKGTGTKIFSGITLREYLDPVEEEIEWFIETGNLGLDTPNQKYISRIQLRIDYKGTLKIEIAYDNDEEYSTVHQSGSDHMRSITVPIRVKRNDHFRIRLSGVGQMRLYSFGYDTDDGGARCLI